MQDNYQELQLQLDASQLAKADKTAQLALSQAQLAEAQSTAVARALEIDVLKQQREEAQQAGAIRASEATSLQVRSLPCCTQQPPFLCVGLHDIPNAQAAVICLPTTMSRPVLRC